MLDECFQIADVNGVGRLYRAEFEIYFRRIGECAVEQEIPWRGRDDPAFHDMNYKAYNGYN